VRIGRPRGLIGLPEAQSTAAFATLAGLVLHGSQPRLDLARTPLKAVGKGGGRAGQSSSPLARLFQTLRKQI